jgi:DNA-binding transcriptional LysR family regulator
MEFRHLRYFVTVAELLSFTKAAQKLHVAQPALSRQIRQLEDEVGLPLLSRNRRSVSLTPAGTAFLSQAQALLEQSVQAIRTAQSTVQPGQCAFNVGYVWGLFHSLIPETMARFHQQCPQAAINLFDLTATQQAESLVEGRLDAGLIGFAHEADAAKLAKRSIGQCTFMAALPENHPVARKRVVPLEALAQDFFFAISEQSYPGASHYVTEACAQAGFRPKILQNSERGFTILGLVAGNCGVALLPESLRALPHSGVVFRPLVKPPRAELFVAWNPSHHSPLLDSFLALFPPPKESPLH